MYDEGGEIEMQRIGTALLFCCCVCTLGCDAIFNSITGNELSKIEQQVAQDMTEQYNIAKRSGDKMQTCVQAGLVAAAYLQAKDESNYNKWQRTKKRDCKAAGVNF